MNRNFYNDLKTIEEFSKIMEDKNFSKVPNDWHILVCDIKDSTKAIEEGKYKQVNFVAALSIIGVLNIDKELDFPYIFGGDGSSLIIPSSLVEKSKKALIEAKKIAKDSFDLELRIGIVSIKEIEKRGFLIEICKHKISENYIQAIVRGKGLELAEELLKTEYETFKIDESTDISYEANFQGLECRWEDIKSPKDETISILIKAINLEKQNEIYKNCINKIEEIAGIYQKRNPIQKINQLVLSFNPKKLSIEASVFSKNKILKIFVIFRLLFENLLGLLLMKFSIGNWSIYKDRITHTTDTEKFDDMLRMVICTTNKESQEIETFLEKEFKSKNIIYGIHKSDSALMTCLIFQRHGKHTHFVDASNGGYALAAKEMKKRLKNL